MASTVNVSDTEAARVTGFCAPSATENSRQAAAAAPTVAFLVMEASSESQREAAVELELVRVLRVAGDVAAPVRVAPPALGICLDVGGRPLHAEADADMRRGEDLDARSPSRRELCLVESLAGLSVRPREAHAAIIRGAESEEQVGPDLGVDRADVVGHIGVIRIDGEIAHLELRGAADGQRAELLTEQEADFDVFGGVETYGEAPGGRVLQINSVVDMPVSSYNRSAGHAVRETASKDGADLDALCVRRGRSCQHQCRRRNCYSCSCSHCHPPNVKERRRAPCARGTPVTGRLAEIQKDRNYWGLPYRSADRERESGSSWLGFSPECWRSARGRDSDHRGSSWRRTIK